MVVGSFCGSSINSNMLLMPTHCFDVTDRAIISASVDDVATQSCFLHDYAIVPPNSLITKPLFDFLVSLSSDQFASA